MTVFNGKKIILGAPTAYGFSEIIEQELRHQGFEVYNLSCVQHEFKYKNIAERLNCYFHKNFLGQKDYKTYLKFKRVEDELLDRVAKLPRVDYAMLIRPDQYSEDIINMISLKADKTVGYQWDGLSRFPEVYKRISLFDRFFVFDPNDAVHTQALPVTNFYTNSFDVSSSKKHESDVYYVGTYMKRRASQLEEIITTLQHQGLSVKYHICKFKSRKPSFKYLETTSFELGYHENLQFAFNSKILLDVPTTHHNGLSFRIFEAIGFEKKLITTNKAVKHYDFYHPNNIFVWDGQSQQMLGDFLDAPYVELASHIKESYSFSSWIKALLREEQYVPVEFPNTELQPVLTY
ncbi:hypothetical protein [Parapedobacter sp. 10938]|uniref:hypothetical protein n=1 Tax=Parapedobacter flavus TaxID=3110225 RepID=UPI002DBDE991|nr:hypothetical protein [Parapedobacter sp. 10938]MEC3878247.1 hypothetical protein [Parapedobacter sp. 10938]